MFGLNELILRNMVMLEDSWNLVNTKHLKQNTKTAFS